MKFDYKSLGFKCGLEIHQQLLGRKLFCNCPVSEASDLDVKIERRLRAVAGEIGGIDLAAQFEMAKDKRYVYESSSVVTCLVEFDEAPPHMINNEALDTALTVALLFNAKIVDEIQIMRKTVVDGSNVSGFQRTALVATGGYVETSKGKVSIPTVCIEEEAAQKIEQGDDFVKYNLNRLGIPLIEIATGTEIIDAQHAKETASIIGMILRSTDKVVRGIGSIRQDVNLSIEGGARIEIKGFQDMRAIPRVIDFEINRQQETLAKGEKINEEVRKSEPDFTTSFLRPMPGSARMYPETDIPPIRIWREYVDALKQNLPRLIIERVEDIEKKYELSPDVAKEIISGNKADVFEILIDKFGNVEPSFIAQVLITLPKEIRSRFGIEPENILLIHIERVLSYLNEGVIPREAVVDILPKIVNGEEVDLRQYERVSEVEIEEAIRNLIAEKSGLRISAYMGIIMGNYRGKTEGKTVMELLRKYIKE